MRKLTIFEKVSFGLFGTVAFLVIVIFLILTVIHLTLGRHEDTSKNFLKTELDKIINVPGCSPTPSYQTGGVDTVSSWIVKYDCQTTAGQAYETIMKSLAESDYHKTPNSSEVIRLPNEPNFYAFYYESSCCYVSYAFLPLDNAPEGMIEAIHLDIERRQ